jgi:excisionase family DNA binding protein
MIIKGMNAVLGRWLAADGICDNVYDRNQKIYNWIKQRTMPGHRAGRLWMFKQAEVDEWVRSSGAADKSCKPDTDR